MPIAYVEFQICREMHWTYAQLDATPTHRVDEILEFLRVEASVRDDGAGDAHAPMRRGILRRRH